MDIKINEEWKNLDGKYTCPFCQKVYSRMGICTHIWRLHGDGVSHNPFKDIINSGMYIPWNRGLTKETSSSVKKQGETHSSRMKSGETIPSMLGKKFTPEQRKKLSNIIKKKVDNGTWHYSFSKVRTHKFVSKYVGEVSLMGSWEWKFAKYLDDNNIEWKRPKDKFYYEYEKLNSGFGYYIPDFYLVKENRYVEIKGYETDKDRAKWKWFPHPLEIIKGKDLTEKYKIDLDSLVIQ
jgi:hypothetical protein